jgi:type II secretory pathway component PulF
MARFHYQATDADGTPTSGEMEAADANQLLSQLDGMGLRVTSIAPIHAETPGPSDGQSSAQSRAASPGRARLSQADVNRLAQQLKQLSEAELPLAPGLKAFAEELPPGRLRRVLAKMVRRLEKGEELEAVLAGNGVPDALLALLRAGVRTGATSHALSQYLMHARQFMEVKRRMGLVLGYPLIVLAMSVFLFVFFLVLVVPEFKTIFRDFGIQLPAVTVLLLRVSDLVEQGGRWILLALGGGLLGIWSVYHFGLGERWKSRVIGRLPLLGRMVRYTAMARFAHLLALLMEEQVPLPEAIVLAGSGSGDPQLREASDRLARRVAAGDPLASCASEYSCFPSTFVQAVRWERHGEAIPELLRALADMFQAQTRDRATAIAAVCEPVIIGLTAGLLGFMAFGLFLPLVSLISSLSY